MMSDDEKLREYLRDLKSLYYDRHTAMSQWDRVALRRIDALIEEAKEKAEKLKAEILRKQHDQA